jgi:hypothetical protein
VLLSPIVHWFGLVLINSASRKDESTIFQEYDILELQHMNKKRQVRRPGSSDKKKTIRVAATTLLSRCPHDN